MGEAVSAAAGPPDLKIVTTSGAAWARVAVAMGAGVCDETDRTVFHAAPDVSVLAILRRP